MKALPPDAPYGHPHAPARAWGFEPENVPELTPEQVALHALEEKLADARRSLRHACHTRSAFRLEVRALAALAEQLHHQVLRELARAESARCSTCGPRSAE